MLLSLCLLINRIYQTVSSALIIFVLGIHGFRLPIACTMQIHNTYTIQQFLCHQKCLPIFIIIISAKLISVLSIIIIIVPASTAMTAAEVEEKMGLPRLRDRIWYVQPTCATTGDGLYEGLEWLRCQHVAVKNTA